MEFPGKNSAWEVPYWMMFGRKRPQRASHWFSTTVNCSERWLCCTVRQCNFWRWNSKKDLPAVVSPSLAVACTPSRFLIRGIPTRALSSTAAAAGRESRRSVHWAALRSAAGGGGVLEVRSGQLRSLPCQQSFPRARWSSRLFSRCRARRANSPCRSLRRWTMRRTQVVSLSATRGRQKRLCARPLLPHRRLAPSRCCTACVPVRAGHIC